jgi:acetyl-CoA synthetase
MLELVADNPSEAVTITYKQGSEKCNQLLNLLRKQGVTHGDDVFIMCGLNEGLWISYLSAIKGGLILIPAASILTVNDIVYRFEKASPKIISQIRIMQKKWTRLYYNTITLLK